MLNDLHVGNIGFPFYFTVKDEDDEIVNLLVGTTQVIFKRPDESVLTKTGTYVTDGSDGQVKYTTIAGDIDQHGKWFAQAKLTAGTSVFYSDTVTFWVEDNLA